MIGTPRVVLGRVVGTTNVVVEDGAVVAGERRGMIAWS